MKGKFPVSTAHILALGAFGAPLAAFWGYKAIAPIVPISAFVILILETIKRRRLPIADGGVLTASFLAVAWVALKRHESYQ